MAGGGSAGLARQIGLWEGTNRAQEKAGASLAVGRFSVLSQALAALRIWRKNLVSRMIHLVLRVKRITKVVAESRERQPGGPFSSRGNLGGLSTKCRLTGGRFGRRDSYDEHERSRQEGSGIGP